MKQDLTAQIAARYFGAMAKGQDSRNPHFEPEIGKVIGLTETTVSLDCGDHIFEAMLFECQLFLCPIEKISEQDLMIIAKMIDAARLVDWSGSEDWIEATRDFAIAITGQWKNRECDLDYWDMCDITELGLGKLKVNGIIDFLRSSTYTDGSPKQAYCTEKPNSWWIDITSINK